MLAEEVVSAAAGDLVSAVELIQLDTVGRVPEPIEFLEFSHVAAHGADRDDRVATAVFDQHRAGRQQAGEVGQVAELEDRYVIADAVRQLQALRSTVSITLTLGFTRRTPANPNSSRSARRVAFCQRRTSALVRGLKRLESQWAT
jgi:hypothetical protein